MSAPTDLYLIRHAQAVVNVTAVMGGPRGDTGLTELGVRQAHALHDRLAASGEIRPDLLLTSSLPRARQTAGILAPALGRLPIEDDDLQELRVGPEADGLSLDEYTRRYGWVDLADHPLRPVDPGGESWASFMLRVATTLDRIAREHAGATICAVTHGGVIDGALIHFFGMNAHALPPARLHTTNASITHWRREARGAGWIWRLLRYNDDYHVRALEPGPTIDLTEIPATNPES